MAPIITIVLAALLSLAAAAPARAHPHIWIQTSTEFVTDGKAFTALHFSWLFDPMFSSVLIGDYDQDRDGRFSEQEIKAVQEKAFSNLKEYYFFTFLRLDERQLRPQNVDNFSAAIEDKTVRYRFSFPLSDRPKTIEVSVFDETYFVALQPGRDQPFSIKAEGGAAPTCAAGEGKSVQGLFGSFSPPAIICSLPATQ